MEQRFTSDTVELVGSLSRPGGSAAPKGAVVLCHGFPDIATGAVGAGRDLPELAERIASTMGMVVFTFTFRGCGASGGDFSLTGWVRDIEAAIEHLLTTEEVESCWLVGFGTGGGLCLHAAADPEQKVTGVATLGAPGGFDEWASHTRRFLQHCREVGAIRNPAFPYAADTWSREFRTIRPVDAAAHLAPRPLLVVHGSDDESVPVFDGRVLADAHGAAELRIIEGAGHGLRHDPRAIAVLLGWLDRENARLAR